MATKFNWAQNQIKLNRAIVWVDEQVRLGALPKATEEAYKERYIAIGGLVIKDNSVEEEPVEAADEAPAAGKTGKK